MPIHLILLVFSLVLAVVAAFYQPSWPAHPGWLAVAFLAAAFLVP